MPDLERKCWLFRLFKWDVDDNEESLKLVFKKITEEEEVLDSDVFVIVVRSVISVSFLSFQVMRILRKYPDKLQWLDWPM